MSLTTILAVDSHEFTMRLPSHLALSAALIVITIHSVNARGQGYAVLPHQEVRVAPLPSIVADSRADADVIAASVATAVMDPEICCGRKSALEDQVGSITRFSLKDLGAKLRGKHYLDSGASVVIQDEYWPAASVNSDQIIVTLQAQRPLLMTWNGHLFVVYGVAFNQYAYDDGTITHVIEKLLLLDTRFDDDRRYVTFNRQTDDWTKVSGLLSLSITR